MIIIKPEYVLKKVQITCPNCKYEFPYNKQALEKKIHVLGNKISELQKLISALKKIPKDKLNVEELKRVQRKIDSYIELLSDLKLVRETLKESEDKNILCNLKAVLKEQYGQETYVRLLEEALRRSAAYNTEEIMNIGYYSHSGGKRVRKVC